MSKTIFSLVVLVSLGVGVGGGYWLALRTHLASSEREIALENKVVEAEKSCEAKLVNAQKEMEDLLQVKVERGPGGFVFSGAKEQLAAQYNRISNQPFAALVRDFQSQDPALHGRADAMLNSQEFIDRVARVLQTPAFVENPENRTEFLSALEIVRTRLDPAHERGLRFILKSNNEEAKPEALRLLTRLLRDGATADVQAALNSGNLELQQAAQKLAVDLLPNRDAMLKMVEDLGLKNKAEARRSAWFNLLKALENQKESEVLIEVKKAGYKYGVEPERQAAVLQAIQQAVQKVKSLPSSAPSEPTPLQPVVPSTGQ